ncbi:MAG: flagellar hook-associated protein FlgK [Nitrospirota bacterium]
MSILGVFDIGKTAMYVTRKSLDTTAHNVANINTPGYTRQELLLENVPSGAFSSTGLSGRGVKTTGVTRLYDSFVSLQIKTEKSNLAYWEAYEQGILKIENVFNEASESGLSTAMTDFFNAWQELANNPEGYAERSLLIKKAEYLASRVNRAAATLDEERNELVKSSEFLVDEVNTITAKIADLNEKISASPGALDLMDQRDSLVERLNEIVKVTTFEDNVGRYSVMISGVPLVDGARVFQMDTSIDLNNDLHFYVNFTSPTGALVESREISQYITGGELKANYYLRDTQIPEYINKMNVLALNLSDAVNYYHRQGYGADGSTGNNFFNQLYTATETDAGAPNSASVTSMKVTNDTVFNYHQYRITYDNTLLPAPPFVVQDITDGTTLAAYNAVTNPYGVQVSTTTAGSTTYTDISFNGMTVRISDQGSTLSNGDSFDVQLNANAALEIGVTLVEPQKIAAAQGEVVTVDDTNNSIRFSENGGTSFVTATIPSGNYTRSQLAAVLQQALQGADSGTNFLYDVTYNAATRKYTVTNADTLGANDNPNAIVLDWTNTASTARGLFGFTSNSTISAAGSDISDNAVYPVLPGDNRNAKAIAGLANQAVVAGRKPIDFYREIVSDVGVESLSAKDSQKFQRALVDELEGRRQQISGISLDEEAANLIKYQKSFEAAAKMIGIADELLEVLLGMTGR